MEHLRYPEDLFKVQRYQYARYHVTDPSQWFQGNDRWEVPEDPNNRNNLQPPYRMFTNEPIPEGEAAPAVPEQTWSLTSTFVPFDRKNLAAFVSVDSDATLRHLRHHARDRRARRADPGPEPGRQRHAR